MRSLPLSLSLLHRMFRGKLDVPHATCVRRNQDLINVNISLILETFALQLNFYLPNTTESRLILDSPTLFGLKIYPYCIMDFIFKRTGPF